MGEILGVRLPADRRRRENGAADRGQGPGGEFGLEGFVLSALGRSNPAVMYRLFLIFLLSGTLCGLSARALSVTAKIIGTGIDAKGNQLCEVQAEVKNPSDMAVTVIMMSCGWCESWSVIPTDIFEVYGWECAKNVAGRYDFVAGGGFVFRFWIVAPVSAGKIEGKKIKLGFRFAQEPKRMPGIAFRPSREIIEQAPLVWSEEVTVPRIEQKPVTLPWQGTRTAAAKL